jgi:hypothetical protein
MDNRSIARKLLDYANYLDGPEASVYRVRAYRRAAETVLSLVRPVSEIVAAEGRKGLESLPGIGRRLSYTLDSLAATGEFLTLDSNQGHIDPENLLTSLPGIGPRLARRIHDRLGIDTLEELERAAHDGRLRELGIGPKRLRGLIDALSGRLGSFRLFDLISGKPSVADLLAVDQAYRNRAEQHLLPLLTPRRFNPNHQPWLPLLNTKQHGWRFRALYSNTALAHRLNQTRDWVVIYFYDGRTGGQRTIVTETRGDLRGRRVVRGRERECRVYYQKERQGAVPPTGQPALPFGAALSDEVVNGC